MRLFFSCSCGKGCLHNEIIGKTNTNNHFILCRCFFSIHRMMTAVCAFDFGMELITSHRSMSCLFTFCSLYLPGIAHMTLFFFWGGGGEPSPSITYRSRDIILKLCKPLQNFVSIIIIK